VKSEIEKSRSRLERSLAELGGTVESEVGWAPRVARWAVPIVAAAVGLVVGLAVRRSWPRLGRGR
jgi:hypothetical protein